MERKALSTGIGRVRQSLPYRVQVSMSPSLMRPATRRQRKRLSWFMRKVASNADQQPHSGTVDREDHRK